MLTNLANTLRDLGQNVTVDGDRLIVHGEVIRCTLVGYVVAQNNTHKVILGSTAHDAAFLADEFIAAFR